MAAGSGTGNRVAAASSRAAAASDSSARRAASGSAPRSGKRAASPSPMRKMALTVPGEATRRTGSPRHRGNWPAMRSLTSSADTGSSPACMAMAASVLPGRSTRADNRGPAPGAPVPVDVTHERPALTANVGGYS